MTWIQIAYKSQRTAWFLRTDLWTMQGSAQKKEVNLITCIIIVIKQDIHIHTHTCIHMWLCFRFCFTEMNEMALILFGIFHWFSIVFSPKIITRIPSQLYHKEANISQQKTNTNLCNKQNRIPFSQNAIVWNPSLPKRLSHPYLQGHVHATNGHFYFSIWKFLQILQHCLFNT